VLVGVGIVVVIAAAILIGHWIGGGGSPMSYQFTKSIPDDYMLTSDGKLDMASASRTTIAASPETAASLAHAHFLAGHARSWVKGNDTIQIAIFGFGSNGGATAFRKFELNYAVDLAGTGPEATRAVLLPISGVASATGFFADGLPSNDEPLFVTGCWIVKNTQAVLVQTSGPVPQGNASMVRLCEAESRTLA
jgi:hypothetical protein